MENLRNKIHRLIEQLSENELKTTWEKVYSLHCDFEVKKAIEQNKDSHQPWDFLTYDQAIRYLEESGDGVRS